MPLDCGRAELAGMPAFVLDLACTEYRTIEALIQLEPEYRARLELLRNRLGLPAWMGVRP